MDQMADEITLRADVKDKEKINSAEENTAWVTGERTQTETHANARRLSMTAENESGETNNDTSAQRPRECNLSSSPLLSLKMYLRRSSPTDSSTEGSLSSSQQTNTGATDTKLKNQRFALPCRRNAFTKPCSTCHKVSPTVFVDCAGIVLNCLFCRFYDVMLMLPNSCERVVNNCCPNHRQVPSTVASTPSSEGDFWTDMDCGLFTSCHDANDCLELAMEVSEICYH